MDQHETSNSQPPGWLAQLGPFRTFLVCATAILVLAAPFGLAESQYENWRIIPTVVSPVLAVVLIFLLPLDMLMSWVFAAGDASRRARLGRVIRIEAAALVALGAAWSPYILRLFPN
jgi:hypothetical protein